MTGRQVSFYLTPLDQSELEARLHAAAEIFFIEGCSNQARPQQLADATVADMGKTPLRIYLVRPEDMASVVFRFVEDQQVWLVDDLRSPVIEFDRCYFARDLLRRGRLYYVPKYYREDGVFVSKSADFLAWSDGLLKVARKSLTKIGNDYIGRQALAWKANHKNAVLSV
jgi:hypothetical protein